MVKRFLPLLLVLLLIPCLVIPASATTQGVIDAIEDTLTTNEGKTAAQILYNIWLQVRDTKLGLGLSEDYNLLDLFQDFSISLGEAMGENALNIMELIQNAVDRLDWLDSQVRDVETAIQNGFDDTTGKLTAILEQIYTNGTLTIGEYVKGIRSYIVDINTKLETGGSYGIGEVVRHIYNGVESIPQFITSVKMEISKMSIAITEKLDVLINGDSSVSDPVVDNAEDTMSDLEDMKEILSTAPTIDDSGFDSSISGVNGKFQNITSDADGTLLFGALGEIASGNIFSQLLPTSAMLGVLSFALFGRVF